MVGVLRTSTVLVLVCIPVAAKPYPTMSNENLLQLTSLAEEQCLLLEELFPQWSENVTKFTHSIYSFLAKVHPVALPVPASKEECLEEADKLLKGFELLYEVYEPVYKQLIGIPTEAQKDFHTTCMFTRGDKNLRPWTHRLGEVLVKFLEVDVAGKWSHVTQQLLQITLQCMVEEQEKELREWFFRDVLGLWAKHVTIAEYESRAVVFSKSRDFPLPPEIMAHIYSFCDLETCVSLRQASSAWYSVFQQSHAVLRDNMKHRNPWIEPGEGDFSSWQECVLVFVSRLKRWTCTDDLDGVQVPEDKAKPQTVVGIDLKEDEDLPENFIPLIKEAEYLKYTVLSEDSDRQVIQFKDVELTVPASVPLSEALYYEDGVIAITQPHGMLIMPTRCPTFDHGFAAPRGHPKGHMYMSFKNDKHLFADFDAKRMVEYDVTAQDSAPQGLYDGLIWFWNEIKKILVPTFVDLATGKVYYNKDRIICGVPVNHGLAQGNRSSGLSQFMTYPYGPKPHVVDMATGKITLLAGIEDSPRVVPGFVDGRFRAYVTGYDEL